MKREVGLWIDQNETIFVTIINGTETIRRIKSNVVYHGIKPKSKKSNNANLSQIEETNKEKFLFHLNQYYDGIISFIKDADSILIFGPGIAKKEFEKRLINKELGDHILGVETVGKMTEKQISDKVRYYYLGH